jgi:hypothetical protein
MAVGDTLGFDKSTVSRVVDFVTDALVARKDQHKVANGNSAIEYHKGRVL